MTSTDALLFLADQAAGAVARLSVELHARRAAARSDVADLVALDLAEIDAGLIAIDLADIRDRAAEALIRILHSGEAEPASTPPCPPPSPAQGAIPAEPAGTPLPTTTLTINPIEETEAFKNWGKRNSLRDRPRTTTATAN